MIKEPRSILICGDTTTGKTTQLALFANWLWNTQKLKSKLIIADASGAPQFDDMGLIENGIVDRFNLLDSTIPIAHLNRIASGYWPEVSTDDNGRVVIALNNTERFKVDWNGYGAVLFDGISGASQFLAQHASSPDTNIKFKLGTINEEDGYTFGTMSEGHYNVVHKEIRNCFQLKLKRLPVDWIIVTALLDTGEDITKTRCYLPATVGKATKKEVPSWYQDMFHLDNEVVTGKILNGQFKTKEYDEDIRTEVKVAWFRDHLDKNSGIPYKAKYRIAPAGIDLVNNRFPDGFCILDHELGIVRFLKYRDTVVKHISEKYQNERNGNS